MQVDTPFLTPRQLTDRWRGAITTGTLANWRSKGLGPNYVKLGGRVVYQLDQVEAWEAQNMRAANDNTAAE